MFFFNQNMDNTKELSSFIIQPYRRKWLNGYFERMSKDRDTALWDDNVADSLEEQGFIIKESPRSIYRVDKLYAALAKYAPDNAPPSPPSLRTGVLLARRLFGRPQDEPHLQPLEFTPRTIYDITSNKSGSAGLTSWGQTKSESYVRAYERGQQVLRKEKRPQPCIAFTRTQADEKTRLVWGYPYEMTAIEGLFARPLIKEFLKGFTPMAFGMKTGDLGARLRVSSYHKDYAYSIDMSSYDSSLSKAIIHEAFQILASWFDLSQIEPTTGVTYESIWKQIVNYFIHTPIVMPDGNIYKGKEHGVPSGSYFTQMIDSVCNVIICGIISDKFQLHVDKDDIFVLGDDLLFWSNRKVCLDHIAEFATRYFGVKFNSDKSQLFQYDDVIHYLGRDWDKGIPSIPVEDILAKMSQPERFRRYSKDPQKRRREVDLLFMSYASTYYHAYPILMKRISRGFGKKYDVPPLAYEYGAIGRQEDQSDFIDPDKLSGLLRYQMKYGELKLSGRGHNPVALTFWK